MPRGSDDASDNQSRRPPSSKYEIVPTTETGSERVKYALVGHGPGGDRGHGALRFGTHDEAIAHMEKHGLEFRTPAPAALNTPEQNRAMFKGFGWATTE